MRAPMSTSKVFVCCPTKWVICFGFSVALVACGGGSETEVDRHVSANSDAASSDLIREKAPHQAICRRSCTHLIFCAKARS